MPKLVWAAGSRRPIGRADGEMFKTIRTGRKGVKLPSPFALRYMELGLGIRYKQTWGSVQRACDMQHEGYRSCIERTNSFSSRFIGRRFVGYHFRERDPASFFLLTSPTAEFLKIPSYFTLLSCRPSAILFLPT
jgi:hypothetical protein